MPARPPRPWFRTARTMAAWTEVVSNGWMPRTAPASTSFTKRAAPGSVYVYPRPFLSPAASSTTTRPVDFQSAVPSDSGTAVGIS